MTKKAVLDRIVDGKHAVLLVGDNEKEYVIPAEELPIGTKEGDHLLITIESELITKVIFDENETDKTKDRIANKMELLRKRKGSQFRK